MLVSETPYTISIYINHKIKKNHLCASAYTQKQKILVEYLGTKFLGSQYNFKVTFISNNNIEETYLITFHYWSGKFYLLNNQKNEKLYSYIDFFSKICFCKHDKKEKVKMINNSFVNDKNETLAEISTKLVDYCFRRYYISVKLPLLFDIRYILLFLAWDLIGRNALEVYPTKSI